MPAEVSNSLPDKPSTQSQSSGKGVTAWTPGPWEYRLGKVVPEAPTFGFAITAPTTKRLASVCGAAVYEHNNVQSGLGYENTPADMQEMFYASEELEANARLISAAPELYEALKEAESLVIGWAVHHAMQGCSTRQEYDKASTVAGWHPVHREIYEKVKAALAKAEGK